MNKLEFRSLPNLSKETIPLTPDDRSFSEWLKNMSSGTDFEVCRKLVLTLNSLNKMELAPETKFDWLCRLVPILNDLGDRLEKACLDSGFPLTPEEISDIEILVWAHTLLSSSFSDLNHQIEFLYDNWTVQQKASIAYMALYASSQVLLRVSQVYTHVQKGFWLNCYRTYLSAESQGLLDIPVTILHIDNKSIGSIFKKLLVFACCDTDCFRFREMKTLFDLLDEYAGLIDLSGYIKGERSQGLFGFGSHCDEPPKIYSETVDMDCDYQFNVLPVLNFLIGKLKTKHQEKSELKFVDKRLVLKAVETLTKKRNRKYTRISSSENATGYVGFNAIVSLLAKMQGAKKESLIYKAKHDPRIAGNWQVPDLELVPEGDEQAYILQQKKKSKHVDPKAAKIYELGALATTKSIWSQSNDVELLETIPSGDFLFLNSSVKGYAVLWKSESQRIKVGELFAVQPQGKQNLEIGHIRRITWLEDDSVKLGIELLGMQSELVWLVRLGINKDEGQLAIFIPANSILHQPDSIVLNGHRLSREQRIEIHRGHEKVAYRVGKLLSVTAVFQYFELLPAVDDQ